MAQNVNKEIIIIENMIILISFFYTRAFIWLIMMKNLVCFRWKLA